MTIFKVLHRFFETFAGNMRRRAQTAAILLPALICAAAAHALPTSHYATQSRLASGQWVKIAVTDDGIHLISEQTLRSCGFRDYEKVKVYGYGGRRLPEIMDASTYLDDLPQTPSVYVAGRGIVFYAQGVQNAETSIGQWIHPAINPFSTAGYYFISDSGEEPRLEPGTTAQPGATPEADPQRPGTDDVARGYWHGVWHKSELTSPGQCGHLLVGEDFRYTPKRDFRIDMPGMMPDTVAYLETSFVANGTQATTVAYSANGSELEYQASDRLYANNDEHTHGTESLSRRELRDLTKEQLTIGVNYTNGSTVSLANLNYIAVNYLRTLDATALAGKPFTLQSNRRKAALSGAGAETVVWDVTDPMAVARVNASLSGSTLSWTSDYYSDRTYAAWTPQMAMPSPTVAGTVNAQNLHAIPVTDMVIITAPDWRDQAERLAEFHRRPGPDSLSVTVLTPEAIYNEFSSGQPDVMAFRKFFKMMYDRGTEAGHPLRYAVIMSRVTFDNRRITPQIKALSYPTLPAWFTDAGLSDNSAYTTDDVMAFLEDGSGRDKGRDRLSIAIGRLPVTSATSARDAVDKIINYSTSSPKGNWRNHVLFLADDQDSNIHSQQSERQQRYMKASDGGPELFYKKVYVDQYDLISNQCVQGRADFYRYLDEGVMWWSYIGHASPTALTAEGIVTYTDLNGLYMRHWPVIYAATCNFLRWDAPDISGAELLFFNPNGGVSAAISATRPVYISDNGYLSDAIGRNAFERGADGRIRTIGEIYTGAKNNFLVNGAVASNTNKLRYVLLGDPAMRLAIPSARVVLDTVNDAPFVGLDDDPDEPTTLMARQKVTITGHIENPAGELMTGFNGRLNSTLYDAETSYTTQGHGGADPQTYDQQGGRLFIGTDSVAAGKFTINITMPAEVADNYRAAALNLFASADDGTEAVGVNRSFVVYGMDPDAEPDDVPPSIDAFYLNHPTFRDGNTVNPSPMLIATVTDDRAINLSTAGIGHQMLLTLDEGATQYTDVALYYTPLSDGTPGGTIAYPLENLTEGEHTLRLRVWDTGPNSAEATLSFRVAKEVAPVIYDVYTDTNPASVQANFYVSHDRPDRQLNVTIEVFDLMGRRVWEGSQTARSDMFSSVPLVWNLTDGAGRRVQRGIYLYRATVSDDTSGDKTATATRKLAVTAE